MERTATGKVFISYARGADSTLIKPLLAKANGTKWQVIYDEDGLCFGESIKGFERTLGGADNIIILLSGNYFKSLHCLRELDYLYQKGAGHLLPEIIFVDGYSPADIDESLIRDYWQNHPESSSDELEQKLNRLPLVLAWLFGRRDSYTKGYDPLFAVYEQALSEPQNICDRVFASLNRQQKLRYPFTSVAQKQCNIAGGIQEVKMTVDRCSSEIWQEFANRLPYTGNDDAERLAATTAREDIESVLQALEKWLDQALFYSDQKLQAVVASQAGKLLGWFLLTVFDDTELHLLCHQLNRQKDGARLELLQDTDASFQLLTSALLCCPAIFIINRNTESPDFELTGRGELQWLEGGIRMKKSADTVEHDLDYVQLYETFQKQQPALYSGTPGTQNAAEGALHKRLAAESSYLKVPKSVLAPLAEEENIFTALGKACPRLTQIVTLTDKDKDVVQQYLRQDINIGTLNEYVIDIYKRIYQLESHSASGGP